LKYFHYLIFLLISATAAAQTPVAADSVLVHDQVRQNFGAASWGLSHLIASGINKTSFVGLTYHNQSGHFRPAQQAERSEHAGFEAKGISTLNRFKLYGYFSFSRTWQDSLAFSQKGIEEDYSPYYFIAQKAGTFERQAYKGGGIVGYNLVKDKLYIGTGIDYLYHSSARAVDPRSLVTTFRIKFNPSVSYKLGDNQIGAGLMVGYGDEKIEIGYKNDDFEGTLLYPDRISYFNYGYGYLEINQAGFLRRNTYTGLDLAYGITKANYHAKARLRYLISKEDNQLPKTNSIKDETFGIFQFETYAADLLMNIYNGQVSHQIVLNFAQNNGDDRLVKLAARNYTYQATDLSLTYRHRRYNENKLSWDYFGSLDYRDVYRRDAAADHSSGYSYLQPKIGATLSVEQFKKDLFSAQLSVGGRFPLANEIRVPVTQIVSFTRGVAYPDYIYWASKVGEVNLLLNYVTSKVIPRFKTGFEVHGTYLRGLASPVSPIETIFIPQGKNASIKMALKLYF
jgi:hypothetical protein